jgi:hypothetical protein
VAIAGLSYWDSRREHGEAARQTQAEASARATLVLKGTAQSDGRRIVIEPVSPSQVIQSQRYIFPSDVLGRPMEVTAASPQINLDWVATGLGRAIDRRRAKGPGEALLPVGIVTTYVEDGQNRVDRSVYDVGYAWRPRLLGRVLRLQGLALEQRGLAVDLQPRVNRRWAAHASGDGPT